MARCIRGEWEGGEWGALAQLLLAERVLLRENVLTEWPAAQQLASRRRLEPLSHRPRALGLLVCGLLLLVDAVHANSRHAHRTASRHHGRRPRRQDEGLRGARQHDKEKAPHGLRDLVFVGKLLPPGAGSRTKSQRWPRVFFLLQTDASETTLVAPRRALGGAPR